VTEPMDARPDSAPEPLGRNRDYLTVLISQGVSALGDAVTFTALPLLVLALTGSGLAMGVVGALGVLPDFACGMVAGALADRGDRRRMMLRADLGRALLTAAIPASVLLGGPTMAIILVVAAPMGVLRSVFRAGYISSVPALVGRVQVPRGTAILETMYSIGFIVGPSIAGVLSTTIGPGPTLAIDAASFGLSALGLFLVRRPLRAPLDRPGSRMADDIHEGIVFIARHPVLRVVIGFWSVSTIFIAPMITALVFRVTRDLGQSAAILGLVVTAYGVGTIVGSLLATRLGHHSPAGAVLLAGELAMGAGLIGIGLAPSVPAVIVLAVGYGAMETLVVVTYISVRTARSPDRLLGRIASTARVISLGLQPIGLLAGGLLVDAVGGTATIALIGAALCLLVVAFAPVGELRRVRMSDPPAVAA
jgi:MFS family permease